MDVTKFMSGRWLTNAALDAMGGTYRGAIAAVREELVRNPFRYEHDAAGKNKAVYEPRLVVEFADGMRWVPNQLSLRVLKASFGRESERWMLAGVSPTTLRRLRRKLRLTQEQFAKLLGVAGNTVARWEQGVLGMRPTSERLLRLVAADVEAGGDEGTARFLATIADSRRSSDEMRGLREKKQRTKRRRRN